MKTLLYLAAILVLLAGCNQRPSAALPSRGNPIS